MSYKSSNFRKGGQSAVKASSEKSNPNVQQLQELFPTWSEDDLKSALEEANFDIELAYTRISEGHAVQWGEVARKKDKKPTTGSHSASEHHRDSTGGRDRGGERGGRGGRGGRGARGVGRGGTRGLARGGQRDTNGRPTPVSTPAAAAPKEQDAGLNAVNGVSASNDVAKQATATDAGWGAEAHNDGWGSKADANTSTDAWTNGADHTPATWGASEESKAPASVALAPVVQQSRTPATSKMSWAQIARLSAPEKPKVAPAPPQNAVSAHSPTPAAPAPPLQEAEHAESEALATEELQVQQEQQGWEEPTTAEAPSWDDEPQTQTALPVTQDGWLAASSDMHNIPSKVAEEVQSVSVPEPEPQASAPTLPIQQTIQKSFQSSPIPTQAKPATPVSYAKSLNLHKNTGRFKTTDQAVVMPTSTYSTVEKLGVQFGSVSLGGDDVSDINPPELSPEKPTRILEQIAPHSEAQHQSADTHIQSASDLALNEPAVTALAPMSAQSQPLAQSHNVIQQTLPRQGLSQQQPQFPPQLSQNLQHSTQTPSSLLQAQTPSQSSISSQTASTTSTSSPLSSFTQQTTPSTQGLSPYQQSHQPSQSLASQLHSQQQSQAPPQSQLQQQFGQTGFQSQLDSSNVQSAPAHSQQQQQSSGLQGLGNHGFYREPNFFQAPTPPASQIQESGYSSFAPIAQQIQHQAQQSHLGGFGGDQFGGDPRGFYDSYGQPSGFGGRNAVGHDDMGKNIGIPATQTGAAPQNQQASQQPTSQQQQQQQPQGTVSQNTGGQGPFYYYPYQTQVPQYYAPPFNAYYGNTRYTPQQQTPFPPPTQSASPANAKVPTGVQQQSAPYSQGLYNQQSHQSSAYDDGYSHHGQLQHQHSQGTNSLGSTDYNKSLYGGGQNVQSFMSMGQTSLSSGNAPLGQRATGGSSPENTYKQYGGPGISVGGKDIGSQGGSQGGLGQGSRSGVQQQHLAQGLYNSNRFSSGTAGLNQQGQPQQNQGYQQGGGDYYQRGPYWQQ